MKTKQLVYSALIAAIIFICLLAFTLQTSTDIISFAYIIVFATGIVFSGTVAGLGCGIGAMTFDIFSGYTNYAPFTLLAYGLMAFVIGKFTKDSPTRQRLVIVSIVAVVINIVVYFGANALYFGVPFAIGSIPIELINCAIGFFIGAPLGLFLKKVLRVNKL